MPQFLHLTKTRRDRNNGLFSLVNSGKALIFAEYYGGDQGGESIFSRKPGNSSLLVSRLRLTVSQPSVWETMTHCCSSVQRGKPGKGWASLTKCFVTLLQIMRAAPAQYRNPPKPSKVSPNSTHTEADQPNTAPDGTQVTGQLRVKPSLASASSFLQSRVEKGMQSDFGTRMESSCFTFLYGF